MLYRTTFRLWKVNRFGTSFGHETFVLPNDFSVCFARTNTFLPLLPLAQLGRQRLFCLVKGNGKKHRLYGHRQRNLLHLDQFGVVHGPGESGTGPIWTPQSAAPSGRGTYSATINEWDTKDEMKQDRTRLIVHISVATHCHIYGCLRKCVETSRNFSIWFYVAPLARLRLLGSDDALIT